MKSRKITSWQRRNNRRLTRSARFQHWEQRREKQLADGELGWLLERIMKLPHGRQALFRQEERNARLTRRWKRRNHR